MKNFYRKHPLVFVLIILVVCFLAIGGVAYKFLKPQSNEVEESYTTFVVHTQPDDLYNGVVVAEKVDSYPIETSLGELETVHVTDGQIVNVGDPLLTYALPSEDSPNKDFTSQRYAVAAADQNYQYAIQDLQELQQKTQDLQAQATTTTDADELAAINEQLNETATSIKEASRQVDSTKLAYDESVESLNAAQSQAQTSDKKTTVAAKTAGTVILENDTNQENPTLKIVSPNHVVEAKVSEYDYDAIKVGDTLKVVPTNGSKETTGKVVSVDTIPQTNGEAGNASAYKFRVSLAQPIQIGFSVMLHKTHDDVLIPQTAEQAGQVWLQTSDGKFEKHDVKVETVGEQLKVLSGLKADDVIIENYGDYHE
jgi:HlyD family secretion protein